MKLDAFNIQSIHSAQLSNDSSVTVQTINWRPDYWVIVVRGTSGYVLAYPSAQRGAVSIKLDRGTIVVPIQSQEWTIETVGFSGWYSLYPVHELDGLRVQA